MEALALKYRPQTWDDVTEQSAVSIILQNQINSNSVGHGYLFTGPAGTGKTTSARIFANEINHGKGQPIELDAASHNSVDDIRQLIEQAQTKSLDGEYKIFIIDEVHMVTTQGFNAFLKTLEEPPEHAIFILCTTDPQKIPETILSRVQRYNFQKISTEGIYNRLIDILVQENITSVDKEAIEYIAKLANGGMRDAITLLDKCLSYTHVLTEQSVVEALGVADYNTMLSLNNSFFNKDDKNIITIINTVYSNGLDLKLFIKNYFEFILDICILYTVSNNEYIKLPSTYVKAIRENYSGNDLKICKLLLDRLLKLQSDLKYEQNPKYMILANLLLFNEENK